MSSRFAALLALALVGLLVPASSAFASTLTSDGQDVTWTADAGAGSQRAAFMEYSTGDLFISTSDDPVEYDDLEETSGVIDSDCVDDDSDPTISPAETVVCTGIDSVTADGGGGDDELDASNCNGWFCDSAGLETIRSTLNGGLGVDDLDGGHTEPATGFGDVLNGGQGDDNLDGSDGNDDLNGDDDDDELYGGDDDDELNGGDDDDLLEGHEGNDVLRAGNGDDNFYGDDGADDIDGEDGRDNTYLRDDGEIDEVRGGLGQDRVHYNGDFYNGSEDDHVTINENALNDDGDVEDDPGNDIDGFENVVVSAHDDARTTVMTASTNDAIEADDNSRDEFSPGDGVDFLTMGQDNDVANTVDGFPDVVDCGEDDDNLNDDIDTANADQFDDLINCETQNITEVESAYGDPDANPPTVAFTSPADGAFLPAASVATLAATASDDSGVQQVVFMDDGEVVCSDFDAPYECEYQPTSADVGENALAAYAVDNSGQIGVDFIQVTVGRFKPTLDADTNNRDLNGRRVVRASGELDLPEGVSAEDGCAGFVKLVVRDGGQKIVSGQTRVRDDCSFRRRLRLRRLGRIDRDKVKTVAKFQGNDVLRKDKDPAGKTRIFE